MRRFSPISGWGLAGPADGARARLAGARRPFARRRDRRRGESPSVASPLRPARSVQKRTEIGARLWWDVWRRAPLTRRRQRQATPEDAARPAAGGAFQFMTGPVPDQW